MALAKDDFEAMQENPEAQPHMKEAAILAEKFEPALDAVVSVHHARN